MLGLAVLSLAIPHNREVKFGAYFLLPWRIKWHLWTQAHVYACFPCTYTHTNTPCLAWQSPKVSLYFCMSFSSTIVNIQQVYFGPFQLEWNLQSKRNKKEMGREVKEIWKAGCQRLPFRYFFSLSFSKKIRVKQCWASDFPGMERLAVWERCLGKPWRST